MSTRIIAKKKIDLEFLEKIKRCLLSYRLKRISKLVAVTESATTADGEADGFTTTNETAPPRYPLWLK